MAIWDKANVEGKVAFPGIVEQGRTFVPRLRQAGADVIIVSFHSGADTSSSYGDVLPYPENASTLLAQQVPGIDAILVGHGHLEIAQRCVTNDRTGKQVLLTQPLKWGMRLSVIDIDLVWRRGEWHVRSATSSLLNANTAPEDPKVAQPLRQDHEIVRSYVNSPIGANVTAMSAQRSPVEDTAAMDSVNVVQVGAVKEALAGSAGAALPMLSIAAPFNRAAAIPAGQVTVRDAAGRYKKASGTGPFTMDQVTNAVTPTAPNGTPDYNYDIMGGLDAPLTYDIDISVDPGSRVSNLAYGGAPVDPAAQFIVAINNYRQSGGGNVPGVTTAPVVYNAQVEVRQLIIDHVTAVRTIDSATFSARDWRLTSGGAPVVIS